jgi:CRISPR-associated protein Csm1
MIILGDISGIQRFVFDVSETGGGQSRRLRARSFLVQALAECAALRVLDGMGWPLGATNFLFSGAGKFILRGSGDPARVGPLFEEMNRELLRETLGELRLALGVGEGGSEAADYRRAQTALQRAKASAWRPVADWEPNHLVLPPLDTPCALCRRARATEDEADPDSGEPRRVCRHCSQNYRLGRALPRARAMLLRDGGDGDFSWFGVCGKLVDGDAHFDGRILAVVGLDGATSPPDGCPPGRFIARRLMTSIPLDSHGEPVWFTELARRAKGDQLLAVLKADVDSLGMHVERRLQGQADLAEFVRFADSLDAFFAMELRQAVESDRQWKQSIYTVFAGGDDLVMIGPWDVIFRFAGHVRELFGRRFPELTLSAGVSLFKPKRPVKTAIEQAERLLEQAKEGPKDQCAALGQVWNWNQHASILRDAEQLAEWMEAGQVQRGWLHTLLELAVARHGDKPDPLATARLAYHVNRNYPRNTEARAWAEGIVRRFDDINQPDIRYLPATFRHALTATRKAGEEE